MAVDDKHPEYVKNEKNWKKCRDAAEGQQAIHAAGEEYLHKLTNQDKDAYEAYKERASFYEATGRTVDGMTGMIFRKTPLIEENEMTEFVEDVTLDGRDMKGFAQDVTKEAVEVGRLGILVDHPTVDEIEGVIKTKAQVEMNNERPFFKEYMTESIIHWCVGRINNKTQLTEVRLREYVEIETEDEFEKATEEQIRVLEINEAGQYQQRIFKEQKDKSGRGTGKWAQVGEAIVPMANGVALNYIPFVFINTDSTSPAVQKPPMIGIVNVNISHYRTTADLEHGAHFTGLPTAVISGHVKGDEETFMIGSTTAWVFSDPDASASYLEFEGKGLSTLQELLKEKEAKMAALGAQMLTPSERRNEAADTAEMRHMGENSVLSSISQTITEGLNTALEYAAQWQGLTTPAVIKLNTDFMPSSVTPQMMRELLASWQSGGISFETYQKNLQRGEILDSEADLDEEKEKIQTEKPTDI